jgi:hypothetical protein
VLRRLGAIRKGPHGAACNLSKGIDSLGRARLGRALGWIPAYAWSPRLRDLRGHGQPLRFRILEVPQQVSLVSKLLQLKHGRGLGCLGCWRWPLRLASALWLASLGRQHSERLHLGLHVLNWLEGLVDALAHCLDSGPHCLSASLQGAHQTAESWGLKGGRRRWSLLCWSVFLRKHVAEVICNLAALAGHGVQRKPVPAVHFHDCLALLGRQLGNVVWSLTDPGASLPIQIGFTETGIRQSLVHCRWLGRWSLEWLRGRRQSWRSRERAVPVLVRRWECLFRINWTWRQRVQVQSGLS